MEQVLSREANKLTINAKGFEYKKWKTGEAFPVDSCICNLSYFNGAFDFHWHDGPELSVVIRGQMEYLVNDKHYHVKEGDCVFANSGAMHSGRSVDDGGCQYLVVSFLTGAIDGAEESFFSKNFFGDIMDPKVVPSMVFPAGSNKAAEYCLSIYRDMIKKEDGWEIEVKGLLCQLWHVLYGEAKQQSAANADRLLPVKRVKKAIRYMNENYASRLSLEEIAAECNLSKSEFCRCFKQITRQTAFEYLMDLRIRKSLQLLEDDEDLSITEAALNCGFFNSSYYTKVFRRYMGCTPREYLRKRKEEGSSGKK